MKFQGSNINDFFDGQNNDVTVDAQKEFNQMYPIDNQKQLIILDTEYDMQRAEFIKTKSPHKLYENLIKTCRFVKIDSDVLVFRYTQNDWVSLDTTDADNIIRQSMDDGFVDYVNTNHIEEAKKWIKAKLRIPEVDIAELIKRDSYINFKDGVLDLKNLKVIKEKTPDLYFQTYINMDVPDFEKEKHIRSKYYQNYLESTFDTKEERDSFDEIIGLCISSVRKKKFAIFLFGPSDSGKSIALELIKNIIGIDNVSSLSFSQLGEDFALSGLRGKHINISGEMSGVANKRIDVFKSLVSNELVSINNKGRDYSQFKNTALFIFACNELPVVPEKQITDDSFFNRMQILPFMNVVPEDKKIDDLNVKLHEEREYIVIRAIKAFKRLQERKYIFSNHQEMQAYRNEYQNDVNSFFSFAKKHIRRNRMNKEPSSTIDECYKKYCNRNYLYAISSRKWAGLLFKMYGALSTNITDKREGVNYNARGYLGVELIDLHELQDESEIEAYDSDEDYDEMLDRIQNKNRDM